MKRILAVALTFMLALSLVACGGKDTATPSDNKTSGNSQVTFAGGTGGTKAEVFENKISLSLDKTLYDQAERIAVTMNFLDVDQDNAVIVIANSELPHGQLTPAEETCEEYRWIADFSEIPFYLWAPEKDGLFDVRVYSSGNGEELASVTFAVGNAQPGQAAVPPTEPPKDGSEVKEAFFTPPKAIYMDLYMGGSTATEGTYSFALLDGNYSYTINSDGIFFHDSAETKTTYCPYGEGWRIDNSAYDGGRIPEEKLTYEMTGYLDTFYHDAETNGYYNNISKYYIGTETVCYRDCWVYEIKDDGFGVYKKFWIDPENGATLKYIERRDGEDSEISYEFEVTQYNLLGPVWNSTMRPNYAAVTEMLY